MSRTQELAMRALRALATDKDQETRLREAWNAIHCLSKPEEELLGLKSLLEGRAGDESTEQKAERTAAIIYEMMVGPRET